MTVGWEGRSVASSRDGGSPLTCALAPGGVCERVRGRADRRGGVHGPDQAGAGERHHALLHAHHRQGNAGSCRRWRCRSQGGCFVSSVCRVLWQLLGAGADCRWCESVWGIVCHWCPRDASGRRQKGTGCRERPSHGRCVSEPRSVHSLKRGLPVGSAFSEEGGVRPSAYKCGGERCVWDEVTTLPGRLL